MLVARSRTTRPVIIALPPYTELAVLGAKQHALGLEAFSFRLSLVSNHLPFFSPL